MNDKQKIELCKNIIQIVYDSDFYCIDQLRFDENYKSESLHVADQVINKIQGINDAEDARRRAVKQYCGVKESIERRKEYPLIEGSRRRPDKTKDGGKNYGKPCIICGVGTRGEKWVQVSYMRGDDAIVRVCADHWKEDEAIIINKWLS